MVIYVAYVNVISISTYSTTADWILDLQCLTSIGEKKNQDYVFGCQCKGEGKISASIWLLLTVSPLLLATSGTAPSTMEQLLAINNTLLMALFILFWIFTF